MLGQNSFTSIITKSNKIINIEYFAIMATKVGYLWLEASYTSDFKNEKVLAET